MQFANPLFLIALSALVIPVLIHLFNFRRYKKVFFTNVRFLQQIEQETKKQSKLRQLLILLARLLAVACLVLAFARPYIPDARQQKKATARRAVSVYLDNSFSMEALATEGRLLDQARIRARQIASAYGQSDQFQLLTNDFEGRHQRFVTQEEFLKLVEEVQISPVSRKATEVISRQNDLLASHPGMTRDAYLLSDFQKNTAELAGAKPDTAVSWYFVPLVPEKRSNLYIDSLWFVSPVHQPGQPVSLRVRIRNASPDGLEKMPVRLTVNGARKAVASFSVAGNGSTEVTLPYTENAAGIQYCIAEISDYPIVYDDKCYFAYTVLPSIPVLSINEMGSNDYLDALFRSDSNIRYTDSPVRQLDYGSLSGNSLLILNSPAEISSGLAQELNRYVQGGGNLVVFPPSNGKADSYNALLGLLGGITYGRTDTVKQRLGSINAESALYGDVFERNGSGKVVLPDNVDLPVVMRHYLLPRDTRSEAEVLLPLQDGTPFLLTAPAGRGRVYIFAAPLDEKWTLFPRHMLFVPTLYKMALLSDPRQPLYYTAGSDAVVEIRADSVSEANMYKIRKSDADFEIIPEAKKFGTGISLLTHGQIRDAGLYTVVRGTIPVTGIAFNFDRKESDPSCFTAAELEQQATRLPGHDIHILKDRKSSLTGEIRQIRQGTPLWKLFIILTLVFIACEIALIRFLKA